MPSLPMNSLNDLQFLGLVLPSPASLLGAILFGVISYVTYRRCRHLVQPALTWTDVALMFFNQQLVTVWVAMVAVQLAQVPDQGMPN